jgi:flagellar biosynthesis/type III secretory pathway protein FliH
LPKLPEKEDSAVWPWLKFFKCKKKEEYKMLAKKHPELEKAVNSAMKIPFRQKWRFAMLDLQMYYMDKRARKRQIQLDLEEERATGRAEGHAEGRAEGRAEGETAGYERANLEIARKMKAMGDTSEKIQAVTDLSMETIANL